MFRDAAWGILERARRCHVSVRQALQLRNDPGDVRGLLPDNGSVWAAKELSIYFNLQEETFSPYIKAALCADPSGYAMRIICLHPTLPTGSVIACEFLTDCR